MEPIQEAKNEDTLDCQIMTNESPFIGTSPRKGESTEFDELTCEESIENIKITQQVRLEGQSCVKIEQIYDQSYLNHLKATS